MPVCVGEEVGREGVGSGGRGSDFEGTKDTEKRRREAGKVLAIFPSLNFAQGLSKSTSASPGSWRWTERNFYRQKNLSCQGSS